MVQRIILKKEPKLSAKHQALSYQAEAFEAIKDLNYAAIFHEQGLGKSKIAVDLILYWLEKKEVDTVLYVAKKSLLHNCKREFIVHSYLKPKILGQNKRENFYSFNSPSRLILTHYEVFKSEKERLRLFLKARNVAVILDESAKIKNPGSSLTQSFFELAPLFARRVIMTGTPVANRPFDIWAQIYFLDRGKSLGHDFSNFKQTTDLSNDMSDNENAREEFEVSLSGLFSKISSFTVRETKDGRGIDLPEKRIKIVITEWEARQYNLYKQIQKEMRAIVIRDGVPFEENAEVLLKRLLRLVQIVSNPALIDEEYGNEPGKLEPLKDVIENIIFNKEKCIVWSSFTDNVDWLNKVLKKYGSTKVHGKLNMERRNKAIDRFLTQEECKVLVATPGAAKEGLTLTVANHVIFYDRSFSLDDYLQAQDRIHRISQVKICYI